MINTLAHLIWVAVTAPMLPLLLSITAIRVDPLPGGAELTIQLNGQAEFSYFTLDDPARLIIDVEGAGEGLVQERFAVERGGVRTVRTTRLTQERARIVVDLDRHAPHEVEGVGEAIRVRLDNGEAGFEPWSTDAPPAADATAQGTAGTAAVASSDAVALLDDQLQQRITVTFQEIDIRDVLESFAEFSGRSIVAGAGVEGSITATIRDQPWDVALNTILAAYGLAAQELPSGIIRVDAISALQDRQTVEPLVTQTFRINYVPVGELAATLDPLRSERGRITTNPSTNTLIVTDVQAVLADVQAILQQLDVRTPQVAIQAKIVFVNRTDVEELGVTYDLKDSQGSSRNRLVSVPDPFDPGNFTSTDIISLGGNSIAALGNANVRVQQPQLEAVLSLILGRHTLISFIDALQSQELSDVQAAPLITTLDNQPAEIWVGERTPIRVVDVGTGGVSGAGASAPRATAELVETGIRLRVTPTITADRRILMQLHAERSSAQLAATDIGVIFQQQQGTTRLMVEDGETAVIGGLTVTESGTTTAGIPLLMDIPLIGRLFRTTRAREQQRDLLIMVTPRIVQDQG